MKWKSRNELKIMRKPDLDQVGDELDRESFAVGLSKLSEKQISCNCCCCPEVY